MSARRQAIMRWVLGGATLAAAARRFGLHASTVGETVHRYCRRANPAVYERGVEAARSRRLIPTVVNRPRLDYLRAPGPAHCYSLNQNRCRAPVPVAVAPRGRWVKRSALSLTLLFVCLLLPLSYGDALADAYSAWGSSALPSTPAFQDSNAVEVGVKFRTEVTGYLTGIRFYKGATNTGTHIANVWTSAGVLLATATFSNETASGWQQVNFTPPVLIIANTVYVASYHAPQGNYAATRLYFANAGVDNGPVHLLKDTPSEGNGVYTYSAHSTFPTDTYQSSNYWVDVVFTTNLDLDRYRQP